MAKKTMQEKKRQKRQLIEDALLRGDEIICRSIVHCDNLWRQGTGLMFRTKKSVEDTAWIFSFDSPRRISLTMMFVFFPIDVIFLDEKKTIVEIATIYPWTFYNPRQKSMYCIELEAGLVHRKRLKMGDVMDFPMI